MAASPAEQAKRRSQGDLDAEFTLVRAAVEHPTDVVGVYEVVSPEDFTDHVCAHILRVVQSLNRAVLPIGFDEIVSHLKPDDVLGPGGCQSETTVADCVRETLSSGSGTAVEAAWCAMRIRAESHRQALQAVLDQCLKAVLGGQSAEVRALLEEAMRLADMYHDADAGADRELNRLQDTSASTE